MYFETFECIHTRCLFLAGQSKGIAYAVSSYKVSTNISKVPYVHTFTRYNNVFPDTLGFFLFYVSARLALHFMIWIMTSTFHSPSVRLLVSKIT